MTEDKALEIIVVYLVSSLLTTLEEMSIEHKDRDTSTNLMIALHAYMLEAAK